MLNSNDMEQAKMVQLGLQQFEKFHLPVKDGSTVVCQICEVDFPCDRMMLFMVLQAVVGLQAMLPSGNLAGMMARFSGGGKS